MARTISAARVASLLGSSLEQGPAYRSLADGLRLLISDGRIPVDTRLPSERELTARLGHSRTTVTRAYALLRERGFLVSRRGSGSVVRLPAAPSGEQDNLLRPGDVAPDSIDLTCAASPAPPGVVASYERAVEQLPSYLPGTGYFPSGLPALREALAARYTQRGLPTVPEQVLVTAGALAGVAIAARALVRTGERVLLESPTYPNAVATWRRSGARIAGAAVDRNGWDADGFITTLRQVAPVAAYLIPDFHNPTGMLMAEDERAVLGRALSRSRTVTVVDESLVELGLDDVSMPPPFATFAADTILVGSASKAFWGGLRVGWLRAPDARVGALVSSRLSLDLGAPLLEQLVLTDLLARRERVLEARRDQVRTSREALVRALTERLPQWSFAVPGGGLALWCELPAPVSSALTTAAERQHVLLAAGPSFAPEGGLERWLRLPYTETPERLTEAVDRLALAWEDALQHRALGAGRSPLVA
jgi:DNA-binding transcriptional MocR family regulator